MDLTRRSFLGTTVALVAAGSSPAAAGVERLSEFSYADVSLTGGPLADMHTRLHRHALTLDEDRILKVYRQRAGLPAPGADMGGWYDANGFVPGHLIGQFISALSRFHANTGDSAAADKARRLVSGYAATFVVDNNPYASPVGSTTWPCYILDKYEVGMIDAVQFAKIEEARELLPRLIDAAKRFIPDHTYDRTPDSPKQAPYDEPYILPENLFRAFEVTGEQRFRDMGQLYLLNKEFFDPLSENRNILPGKHGYSHAIALSSGAKAYEVLGDEKYLRAIRNAWDMIIETQQYASGAWAPKETFLEPGSGDLGESIVTTHDHFETPCCFYAWSKIARYLTRFTGDARYGDGLERALFNTILGSLDPDQDGGYFYYSDYHAQAVKGYYKRKWPCCAGTLLQSVADYPLDLYFHDSAGINVNLYAASEVRWRVNGVPVKLTQRTAYPESERIELQVAPDSSVVFALRLRIPGWLDRPALLKINGVQVKNIALVPGRFAEIRRVWRKGDTIELTLPFSIRALPIDTKHPDTVALMHGPLMLAALNPPETLSATAAALANPRPLASGPSEFECETATGTLKLRPWYKVQREPYSTYFQRKPLNG